MNDNEKLDAYLELVERHSRKNKKKKADQRSPKKRTVTSFMRWKASASMELFPMLISIVVLVLIGGLMLLEGIGFAKFMFYGAGVVVLCGLIFFIFDFYHFQTWHRKANFILEGWQKVLSDRSIDFWTFNSQYWVSTEITIVTTAHCTDKHRDVCEAFLKQLKKKLNKWTLSSDVRAGYTQPNGWRMHDLTLSGDSNARVMNQVRKMLSREFNSLSKLMPGSIERVSIVCVGGDKYHEVYHDGD